MAYSFPKNLIHLFQTFLFPFLGSSELVNLLIAKFCTQCRTCIFSLRLHTHRKQWKHVLNEMGVDNRTPSKRCLIREKMFVAFKDVQNDLTKKAQYVKMLN